MPADVESPCIRTCCLDPEDVCVGCGRTIDEIMKWRDSDPDARRAVLLLSKERLARRRAQTT